MASSLRALTFGMFCSVVACSTPSENGEPGPESPRAGSGTGGASGGSAAGAGGAGGTLGSVGKAGRGGTGTSGSAGSASGAAGTGVIASGGASGAGTGGSAGAAGSSAGTGGDGAVAGSAGASAGAGAGGAGGSGSDPPVYDYAATVENTGADCVVPALGEPTSLPKNSKFPDPFKTIAGSRITKKSEWRCRRQELHAQARKYVYGEKPGAGTVSGSVTSTQISVHVEAEGKSIDFSADIMLPSGAGPFPAIINVGAKGGFGGISLGESRILAQGVAVIYYNHNQIGQEGTPEQSRGKPNPGKFYDIYGGDHSAGLLMAWAWGASRLIDVLQAEGSAVIDAGRLGVTGCSRNGKGAFAIGVFDERIALTIPQETSTAGVPAFRIVDQLNTERTDHNFFGLNWLSNDFEPFVLNADQLPIETHELVAMIAPRGLLVLDNPHQRQMSAPAGHAASMGGLEVYKALGVEGNLSYHSSVSDMAHCSYKNEYTELLAQNIAKFLKHENEEPGQVIVGANGSTNLSTWKDWETPTLSDD